MKKITKFDKILVMKRILLVRSITHPVTDVFIKAISTTLFETEDHKRTFLREAIPYAMAFNNYTVALLCSAMLGELSHSIPPMFYALGASEIKGIVSKHPELNIEFDDELFPRDELSDGLIDLFLNLKPAIQRKLVIWAVDEESKLPQKFNSTRNSILAFCKMLTENEKTDNALLKSLVNTMLSTVIDDEFVALLTDMLTVSDDQDSDDDLSESQRVLCIRALYKNPRLLDIIDENKCEDSIEDLIRLIIKNADNLALEQLQAAVFRRHAIIKKYVERPLNRTNYRHMRQLRKVAWYPFSLMFQTLYTKPDSAKQWVMQYMKLLPEERENNYQGLSPKQWLAYFVIYLQVKDMRTMLSRLLPSDDKVDDAIVDDEIVKIVNEHKDHFGIGSIELEDSVAEAEHAYNFNNEMPFEITNRIKEFLPADSVGNFNQACKRVVLSNLPQDLRLGGDLSGSSAIPRDDNDLGYLPLLFAKLLQELNTQRDTSTWRKLKWAIPLLTLISATVYLIFWSSRCYIPRDEIDIKCVEVVQNNDCSQLMNVTGTYGSNGLNESTSCHNVVYDAVAVLPHKDADCALLERYTFQNSLNKERHYYAKTCQYAISVLLAEILGPEGLLYTGVPILVGVFTLIYLSRAFGHLYGMSIWRAKTERLVDSYGQEKLDILKHCATLLRAIIAARQQQNNDAQYLFQVDRGLVQIMSAIQSLSQHDYSQAKHDFSRAFKTLQINCVLRGTEHQFNRLFKQLSQCVVQLEPADRESLLEVESNETNHYALLEYLSSQPARRHPDPAALESGLPDGWVSQTQWASDDEDSTALLLDDDLDSIPLKEM